MPHGRRGRNERLQLRMTYIVNPRIHKTPTEQKAATVRALHAWFASDGAMDADGFRGVHLIGNWRNPDHYNIDHAEWKTSDDHNQSLNEFFHTFHGKSGALYAIYQKNLKDFAAVGPSPIQRQTKKPKARRRIVAKVVKRKSGGKFVRTNRVAKRKAEKPVRGKSGKGQSQRAPRNGGKD